MNITVQVSDTLSMNDGGSSVLLIDPFVLDSDTLAYLRRYLNDVVISQQ